MARQIRTSAKAVIIQNGKLLAIKLDDGKEVKSKLRRPIMDFYEGKEYTKYLGNEEVGDPECLE